MQKCNLVSCTSGVPTLRGSIPHGGKSCHKCNFREVCSNGFKFGVFVERSVAIDLLCSLILILSVTEIPLCTVNVNFHFPGRFAPINLANNVLARIEREMWINFAHLYLRNGLSKN